MRKVKYRLWGKSYEVFEDGTIRHRGMPVNTFSLRNGYRVVYGSDRGKTTAEYVHRIVCKCFHGDPPTAKHQVAHGDGDRQNNQASNLRWATHQENASDKFRHGTNTNGEQSGTAKLTEVSVHLMRAMYTTKRYYIRDIAAMFGVSTMAARNAIKGVTWKHLHVPYSMPPLNAMRGAQHGQNARNH